jgi:hypothetical protein
MVIITLLILTVILAMVICFRNVLNCCNNFEAGVSLAAFVVLGGWLPTLIQLFNKMMETIYG